MMKMFYYALLTLTFSYTATNAFPYNHRLRRSPDEGEIKYAPCKDIYPQCPEWKAQNWCESPQYKDYMATVCPAICAFCRETSTEATVDQLTPATAVDTSTSPVISDLTAGDPGMQQQQTADYQAQVQQYYENVQVQQQMQSQQKSQQPTVGQINPAASYDAATSYGGITQAHYNAPTSAVPVQYQAAVQPSQVEAAEQNQAVAAVAPALEAASAQTALLAQPAETGPLLQTATSQPTYNGPVQQAQQVPQQQPQAYSKPQQPVATTVATPSKSSNKQSNNSSSSNPQQTSSALYSSKKKENKDNSEELNHREGEPEADATNEKSESESKHLEKSLVKLVKEKTATIQQKTSYKAPTNATAADTSMNFAPPASADLSSGDEEDENEKEDSEIESNDAEQHEINQDDDSNDNAKTFAKEDKPEKSEKSYSVDGSSLKPIKTKEISKKKMHSGSGSSGYHVEKSESKVNSKSKEKGFFKKATRSEQPLLTSRHHPENEATLKGENKDDSEEDSDSGSGSGTAGEIEDALSKDLEELSFLTGLNFDEEDYDVADDISNELLTIESEKKLKSKVSMNNVARSEIDKKTTNTKLINTNQQSDKLGSRNYKVVENADKKSAVKTPSVDSTVSKNIDDNLVSSTNDLSNRDNIQANARAIVIKKIVQQRNKIDYRKPESKTLQLHVGETHTRSEISKPEDATNSELKGATVITADENSVTGSGETESNSGSGMTSNEPSTGKGSDSVSSESGTSSGAGHLATNATTNNFKNGSNSSENKTLLQAMQESGDLKAFAVVRSDDTKRDEVVKNAVPRTIKVEVKKSNKSEGSGESGSGSLDTEENSEIETSGSDESIARDTTSTNENKDKSSSPTSSQTTQKLAQDYLPQELLPGVNTDKKKKKKKVNKETTKEIESLPNSKEKSDEEQETMDKQEKEMKKEEGKKDLADDKKNTDQEEDEEPEEESKTEEEEDKEEVLPGSKEERKVKEEQDFGSGERPAGKLSVVLKQNFNTDYLNSKSSKFQMLAGNIKADFEKALKGSKLKEISFSEATIDGNPRQTGKTRVVFALDGSSQQMMKDLLKLVDDGSVNGLAIVKSSLENEDD